MGPHFIYWWHEPVRVGVKVGYGRDPRRRMLEYAERYNFNPDESSLRFREMRSERAAKYAEERLHRALRDFDLIDLPWEPRVGNGEARELFDMAHYDWDTVAWLVSELLAEVISAMPTDKELVEAEMAEQERLRAVYLKRELAYRRPEADDDVPF